MVMVVKKENVRLLQSMWNIVKQYALKTFAEPPKQLGMT